MNRIQINFSFAQWVETNGPYGGSITATAVLKSDYFMDADIILKSDTSKFINVNSPKGGEVWSASSYQYITWDKRNIDYLRIFYSTDIGQTWTLIEDNVDANSKNWKDEYCYYWNIPNTPSDKCLIKLVDIADSTIFAISDRVFSIIYNPEIIVNRPNGSEKIGRGSGFKIEWESKYLTGSFNILFSLDDGMSWDKIDSINNTEYYWNVPDTISNNCLIK